MKVGTRVTNHYYITCGVCRNCRSGRETLCLDVKGNVGASCDGGYAEYVLLPERNVVPIPGGVSDVDAAVASVAIATPFHACHVEARLKPGETVLVIGAGGGVGIHMVQMARLCGARVLASDIGEDKLELAKKYGADETIDARKGDLPQQVKSLTGGAGVDAVIDIVATRPTLEASMKAVAVGGRLIIIGAKPPAVYGEDPRILEAAGAEVRSWAHKTVCCGASGSVNDADQPQLPMSRIFTDAVARGANCIVTTCPLCQFNVDAYQAEVGKKFGIAKQLPVYFITELIGIAMGFDPVKMQVDRHFIDAMGLVKELNLI